MKVMLLPSTNGQDYLMAVIPPDSMSEDEAVSAAQDCIDAAQAANLEEWAWSEDMAPLLEKAGFVIPKYIRGPQWD